MKSDQAPGEGPSQRKTFAVSADTSRLSIFISYSRKDLGFSDQLVAALDACGFTTTIDRKGIHGAENWERRLGQLILEADVVVFVLTPTSAQSAVCKWEVNQAIELKKRIVPILAAPLGGVNPHEHLTDLNYIYFYEEPTVPGSGFGSGLASLIPTLLVDVEWTREHTRLSALAARWQAENRPSDLLLRGSELARLQRWRDSRPASAPELTILQRTFLQTSEDAEVKRTSNERKQIEERQHALKQAEDAQEERTKALEKLSRRTYLGLIGVSLLAIVSIVAFVFAYKQNQALQGASIRLREGIKLKIADTDHQVIATEKWYRIATDYKLAIGLLRNHASEVGEPDTFATGFLVTGEGLRAEWRDQIVFMTSYHNFDTYGGTKPDISQAYIVFPGVDNDTRLKVKNVLFESRDLDVMVISLDGELSRHAEPVDLVGQIESKDALTGIAVLHWTAQDGFTLGLGHGVAAPNTPSASNENQMYYTHVTGPGASGAPVFDTSSGNVVCLHQGAVQSPRFVGFCTSISKIVSAIKAK